MDPSLAQCLSGGKPLPSHPLLVVEENEGLI